MIYKGTGKGNRKTETEEDNAGTNTTAAQVTGQGKAKGRKRKKKKNRKRERGKGKLEGQECIAARISWAVGAHCLAAQSCRCPMPDQQASAASPRASKGKEHKKDTGKGQRKGQQRKE